MPRFLSLLFALTLVLGASACDSSDPDPDPDPPAPTVTFSIASESQTIDGEQFLLFGAIPSQNVTLTSVRITNPLNQSVTFNAQNASVLAGEVIVLQNFLDDYPRVSGTWTFQFTGALAPPNSGNFQVTTTLSVGAAQADQPSN